MTAQQPPKAGHVHPCPLAFTDNWSMTGGPLKMCTGALCADSYANLHERVTAAQAVLLQMRATRRRNDPFHAVTDAADALDAALAVAEDYRDSTGLIGTLAGAYLALLPVSDSTPEPTDEAVERGARDHVDLSRYDAARLNAVAGAFDVDDWLPLSVRYGAAARALDALDRLSAATPPAALAEPEPPTTREEQATPDRPCPRGAVLMVGGEHFPCDQMSHMSSDSDTHEGWLHSSRAAEAIWDETSWVNYDEPFDV